MSYATIVWVGVTPTVVGYGELEVLQETPVSITFLELSSHFSKTKAVRMLPDYSGIYESKAEAEEATLIKLKAKLADFEVYLAKYKAQIELREPAKATAPSPQQLPKMRHLAGKLEELRRRYRMFTSAEHDLELSRMVQHMHMHASGVLGVQMEIVGYYYPGSAVELPSLNFPDDLDDRQKANCLPVYVPKQTLIESST